MRDVASFEHTVAPGDRESLVARGRRLEYVTIAWNGFEAAVALLSGVLAGSIALVGFGLDSLIETASALVLLWRLGADREQERRELAERRAHRIVGVCFLLLAAYIAIESSHALWIRERSSPSVPGVLIAIAAMLVMPLLGRAKRRAGLVVG